MFVPAAVRGGSWIFGSSGATAPGAPTSVVGVAGATSVTVSWTAPGSDGGASIDDYRVETFIAGVSQGTVLVGSATTSKAITPLTPGTAYTFKVEAHNSVGYGTQSSASSAVTPGLPGAPTSLVGTHGNGQVSVVFTAPASDGGSAITGYTVTSTPGGFTGTGAASPIVVSGLTNGTAYTFTAHATNANGSSGESSASASVTPSTVPGAPTSAVATAGAAQVSVTFTAPASNGGATITGYRATASTGPSATGAASPLTIGGLTNGVAVTVTVAATNLDGYGAESAPSSSVTPTVWTPANLPSPALVLESDAGTYTDTARTTPATADGDLVAAVADQSGAGNHVTQATSGLRPLLKTGSNGINGLPLIRPDGSDDVLTLATSVVSGHISRTLIAVIQHRDKLQHGVAVGVGVFGTNGYGIGIGTGGALNVDGNVVTAIFQNKRFIQPPTALIGIPLTSVTMIGLSIDSAGVPSIYVDGINKGAVAGANAADPTANTYIGGFGSAGYYLNDDILAVYVCGAELSSGDWASLAAYVRAKWAPSAQVICDGDSMTFGAGAGAGEDYPNQLDTLLGAVGATRNFGVSGQTMAQMSADAATQVDPCLTPMRSKNIVVAWTGNDMDPSVGGNVDGTTAEARLNAYCTARRAAGFKVIACTALPRNAATYTTRQTIYNGLVRANWTTYADALADLQADPDIGPNGANTNLTYYNADQLHMVQAGYQRVAEIIRPQVTALVGSGRPRRASMGGGFAALTGGI